MRKEPRLGGVVVLCVTVVAAGQSPARDNENPPGVANRPETSRVVIKFRPQVPANERAALHRGFGHELDRVIPQIDVHAVRIPPGRTAAEVIARYQDHPGVEFAEADQMFPPALIPNDPMYAQAVAPEWHLPKIGAPAAWDITTGSSNVVIAILDSGVNGSHPELAAKMVAGWNVVDNNSDTRDINGHGTMVAGVAAASSNNGSMIASVAWGCQVMPVRVANTMGWASGSDIAEGLVWAADHGARVANLSFAMMDSTTLTTAESYLDQRGGVVVFAAGNSGAFSSAADNPYVLTISATDQNDLLPSWSNTGNNVDLGAPGVAILSLTLSGGVGSAAGTSVAAPIVSGVAALALSVNPSLSATELQEILKQSADDRGAPGWDPQYGAGRVNAARAVQMARDHGEPLPDTTAPTAAMGQPTAGSILAGTTIVSITAADDTGVSRVDLYVDSVLISSDTIAPHRWQLDTRTQTNASHWIWAKAFDAAGNESSPAAVQVTVDNATPTVSLSAPADGSVVTGTVTISAAASDNLALARVEFYRDNGVLLGSDSTSPYSVYWNTGTTTSGGHTLYAKAFDLAGNTATSVSRSVSVGGGTTDTAPPTVSLTSPPNGGQVSTKSSVSVSASATDNVSVQRVEFFVDSVLKCTDTAVPFTCSWQVPPQRGRNYRLQAKAYDPSGNVGVSAINTVTSR